MNDVIAEGIAKGKIVIGRNQFGKEAFCTHEEIRGIQLLEFFRDSAGRKVFVDLGDDREGE